MPTDVTKPDHLPEMPRTVLSDRQQRQYDVELLLLLAADQGSMHPWKARKYLYVNGGVALDVRTISTHYERMASAGLIVVERKDGKMGHVVKSCQITNLGQRLMRSVLKYYMKLGNVQEKV